MSNRDWRTDPRPGDCWETQHGRRYIIGGRGDNDGKTYLWIDTPSVDEHGYRQRLTLNSAAELRAYFDKPDFKYIGHQSAVHLRRKGAAS